MKSVRRGSVADLAAICELWNTVWPHHFRGLSEMTRELEMSRVECRPQFLLMKEDGKVIGSAEFNRDFGSFHPLKWHVSLCVHPNHRNRGVGSALLHEMMSVLQEAGATSITTRVSDDDQASMRFVQRRGYREVKRDFESELDLTSVPKEFLNIDIECPASTKSMRAVDSPRFR